MLIKVPSLAGEKASQICGHRGGHCLVLMGGSGLLAER